MIDHRITEKNKVHHYQEGRLFVEVETPAMSSEMHSHPLGHQVLIHRNLMLA